jgi:hypothetical protein
MLFHFPKSHILPVSGSVRNLKKGLHPATGVFRPEKKGVHTISHVFVAFRETLL